MVAVVAVMCGGGDGDGDMRYCRQKRGLAVQMVDLISGIHVH